MLPAPTQLIRSFWDDSGDNVRRELSRLFGSPVTQEDWVGKYPTDVREDDEAFHVDAELPGFTKDQVDISLNDDTLTITAQRSADTPGGETHLRERRFTKVARSFRLPSAVDEAKILAKLDHGVLHVTLPKRDEVKPRRIQIT